MRDGTETKVRIERAALELFVHRGIEETTIRDIANAAGVSLGAMYVHHDSKTALAEVLFAENFHRIGIELERLAEAPGTLRSKLRGMIAYVFACVERNAVSVAFLFRARQEYARRIHPGEGNPFLAFRKVVANAIANGTIPKQDATVTTAMVIGVINQLVDTHLLGRIKTKLGDLTETVTRASLRLLKGG